MNPIFPMVDGWWVTATPTNQPWNFFCKVKKPSVWIKINQFVGDSIESNQSINQKSIKVGLDKNQQLQNQPWLKLFCFDWFLFVATLNRNPLKTSPFFVQPEFTGRNSQFFLPSLLPTKSVWGRVLRIFFQQQKKTPCLKRIQQENLPLKMDDLEDDLFVSFLGRLGVFSRAMYLLVSGNALVGGASLGGSPVKSGGVQSRL